MRPDADRSLFGLPTKLLIAWLVSNQQRSKHKSQTTTGDVTSRLTRVDLTQTSTKRYKTRITERRKVEVLRLDWHITSRGREANGVRSVTRAALGWIWGGPATVNFLIVRLDLVCLVRAYT